MRIGKGSIRKGIYVPRSILRRPPVARLITALNDRFVNWRSSGGRTASWWRGLDSQQVALPPLPRAPRLPVSRPTPGAFPLRQSRALFPAPLACEAEVSRDDSRRDRHFHQNRPGLHLRLADPCHRDRPQSRRPLEESPPYLNFPGTSSRTATTRILRNSAQCTQVY